MLLLWINTYLFQISNFNFLSKNSEEAFFGMKICLGTGLTKQKIVAHWPFNPFWEQYIWCSGMLLHRKTLYLNVEQIRFQWNLLFLQIAGNHFLKSKYLMYSPRPHKMKPDEGNTNHSTILRQRVSRNYDAVFRNSIHSGSVAQISTVQN
jgi:hypothetical protein